MRFNLTMFGGMFTILAICLWGVEPLINSRAWSIETKVFVSLLVIALLVSGLMWLAEKAMDRDMKDWKL